MSEQPNEARPIPGCGWTQDVGAITGYPWPQRGSGDEDSGCAAQWGHRSLSHDHPTVGNVGLCLGCLEAPADLLRALSGTVTAAGDDTHVV